MQAMTSLPEQVQSTETCSDSVSIKDPQEEQKAVDVPRLIRENAQVVAIVVAVFVYFAAAALVYSHSEDWDFVECIYFAIVVVTTVGYGDFLPTTDGSKIATILMAHFALIIVAVSIDKAVNVVRSIAMTAMHASEDGLGIFNKKAIQRRRRFRSLLAFLLYLSILIVGTLVFATHVDWGEGAGNKWLNGLYLTVITVTTIGFGDFSPDNSDHHGLKIFACALMLLGIPVAAAALALATHMIFGESHEDVHLKVIRDRLTRRKFDGLREFVQQMRADGIHTPGGSQGADRISRFEFLCFVLVQNDVVDTSNLKDVMNNFDDLDSTHTGYLGISDIQKYSISTTESA